MLTSIRDWLRREFSMDMIVQNGTIITAMDRYQADIGIHHGKVVTISEKLQPNSQTTLINAQGKYVFPGIIDAHVHLQLNMAKTVSSDDFVNGTKAAACGGVTTIIDFSTQLKGQSLMESITKRCQEAEGKPCIDYSFHAGITDWDLAKNEMDAAFATGVSSFKMFMAYRKRGLMSEDDALFSALEETKRRGGLIAVHAESATVLEFLVDRYHAQKEQYGILAHVFSRPDIIEIEAIERAIRWAELSGGTLYIVHTSTGGGAMAIRQGRERGVKVYGETCPQYLLLDDSVFRQPTGHLYTSCPQIKSEDNQKQLWACLQRGDFQVLATDHCPFTTAQKDLWQGDFTQLPFGLPGVETLLPLMYTACVHQKGISLHRLLSMLTYQPAKIYGLYPRKGTIAIGSDADLVIFDPDQQVKLDYHNLQTNCDYSPYQGMELHGMPVMTISRGQIVAKDSKFIGQVGHGQFIPRGPCQHLY